MLDVHLLKLLLKHPSGVVFSHEINFDQYLFPIGPVVICVLPAPVPALEPDRVFGLVYVQAVKVIALYGDDLP